MYKIYINNNVLILKSNQLTLDSEYKDFKVLQYNHKLLSGYIDKLEKSTEPCNLILNSNNYTVDSKSFVEYFKIIEAAGGLVKNDRNELLIIYRRGHWDLAKGKIDKNESKESAAIREVKEETGVENIELLREFDISHHVYRDSRYKKPVLKRTYWYEMLSLDEAFHPQAEEDILEVRWCDYNRICALKTQFYRNVYDLMVRYFE